MVPQREQVEGADFCKALVSKLIWIPVMLTHTND